MSSRIQRQTAWKQSLIPLVGLLLFAMVLYRETLVEIVSIWTRSETFTHGFLVLPIVSWLIWRQRETVALQTPTATFLALPLISIAGFAWLMGHLAAVNAVSQLAVVAILVLCAVSILGLSISQVIAFPLLFTFFAVPIGEFLLPPLMTWTADFTVVALRLTGVPVYREGLQFVIPSGRWSVVEACSGVRYLIASLTVGSLFAYLNYRSLKRRMLFVLASILVPIVANWLRAYFIVMLGHLSGNTLAVGVDHLLYGWVFFGIVIMCLFWVGARWSEVPAETLQSNPLSKSGNTAADTLATTAILFVLLVCFLGVPRLVQMSIERGDRVVAQNFNAPPILAAAWKPSPNASPTYKPGYQNPSAESNTIFVREHSNLQNVGLYIGIYVDQSKSRKMVSSVNSLIPHNRALWTQTGKSEQEVKLGSGSAKFRTVVLKDSPDSGSNLRDEQLTVWQIYWVNGNLTNSDYLAKVYSAWFRLVGAGDNSAVIVVYAPKTRSVDGEESLKRFLADNFDAINDKLLGLTPRG